MFRFISRVLAAGLLFTVGGVNAQVVVSQLHGGGGNTGATYRSDYIELHNNGVTSVDLTGWSVQYASSTGTTWSRTNLSGSIAAGGYYLIKQADGANTAALALPTPDATGTIAMSGTAGKVALTNNQTTLTGACPTGGAIVDFVGFGTANCSETAPTPAPSNTLAVLRADSGCTDTANNSADFATGAPNPRNSATTAFVCGGGSTPLVSVNDVSAVEGDSGTTQFFFAFGLSQPAGPGGVSVQYATADGTATAGVDYVAGSGTLTIPEGSNSVAFSVTVNGDTTSEPDETFFVNIVSATGANIADGQGLGTIQNDDVSVVQIHDIQGNGLLSPLNGATVVTEGIVTAQKFNNGFFLQAADANVDADPNTSEGIFVFTSTAPPATAAVGNRVRVAGTVSEFTPSTNLNQLSITEIVSVTSIQVLSTGNPLPAPIALTNADFNAASTPGTAEKYEGMRVSVTNATAISGSDGNITESSATASTTGVFQIVLAGVDKPFREEGIDVLDLFPIPGGKTPPRFDHNAERLMVRSRGQVGATSAAIDADTQVSMVGVMDYFSGVWAILPDVGTLTTAGGKAPLAVSAPGYADITIGGFNLLRFFDEINDSNGAPTLTAAALDKRLTKTSLAICDYLKTPDILGVVEVENLRVLGLLADRINSTCATAPAYVPYLVQGNDVGGINVGFLVSNRTVGGNVRVEVLEVTQYGKTTVLNNPDGSTSLLNDRPPLLLRAIVHSDNGASYPVTAIVNHLRSLNGVGDSTAGSSGWPTENARVSAKRSQQAVFLADLVQTLQTANPSERIVLLGDFNAFEFNDGYVDVMGIIRGEPAPEPMVLTYAASPITTPLVDGSLLTPSKPQRYSYVFDGNLQTLDHVVVNEATVLDAADIEVDHARINAEFGVHNFGVAGTALRVSDHDPVRVRITVPGFRSADLGVTASASPASMPVGGTATYTVVATNAGPGDAEFASVALVFDALVTPTVTPAAGWTCAAPTQNAGTTTVTCTIASFANGGSATFTATVTAGGSLGGRSLQLAAAVASQINDPANANNQATASVAVLANADLSTSILGGPNGNGGINGAGPIVVGGTATFVIPVRNNGPDASFNPTLTLTGDAPVANTSVVVPAGWTCNSTGDTVSYQVVCGLNGSLRNRGAVYFAFSVVAPNRDGNLNTTATVSGNGTDPVPGNNTATRAHRIVGVRPAVAAPGAPAVMPETPASDM